MVAHPRVVFRVEPAEPNFIQALRDIEYGTAMGEADVVVAKTALRNILEFLVSAVKETSRDSSTFLSCFKNETSWPIVVVVINRCEAIIRYCLGQEDAEYVRASLGTLHFIKASFEILLVRLCSCTDEREHALKPQEQRKTRCGMIAAQAEKTIWLYESWWRAPSLRHERGIKPEKGYNGSALDALADALMQAQEGTLFHEIVHLASGGQMKRLLSTLYPCGELPRSLWQGRGMVGDAVFHEHVNTALHSEQIVEAKYARCHKGGETDWAAAYHLVGVRDLATLEKGSVASILNAHSYNTFAASLIRRVKILFASQQLHAGANRGIPNLHPDAVNRLRKAYSKVVDVGADELRNEGMAATMPGSSEYNHPDSVSAQHRNGCRSDLGHWPTLADSAAATSRKSDARRR